MKIIGICILILNILWLIVVCAYSAAFRKSHLYSYIEISKKWLNNAKSSTGYFIQLLLTCLTLPLMIFLIVCNWIALFIESLNVVRKNRRSYR